MQHRPTFPSSDTCRVFSKVHIYIGESICVSRKSDVVNKSYILFYFMFKQCFGQDKMAKIRLIALLFKDNYFINFEANEEEEREFLYSK